MNATILNRDFKHPADGWYMIEPKGEHPNRRGGVVLVIDDDAIQSIATTFNREADEYPAKHNGMEFPGMLVDIEHFSDDASKETRAYAWLMRQQPRLDGVYGQLSWTGTGKPAVDRGDFRFFSSEYLPGDCVDLGGKRVRPTRMDGLTLTNKPNNKGGRPIINREDLRQPAPAGPAVKAETKNKNTMKKIASRLRLSDEASEDSILVELDKYTSRAEITPDALKLLQEENAALKKTTGELAAAQVEADLEKYKNRIKPGSEAKWKSRLLADRTGTIEILEDMHEGEPGEEVLAKEEKQQKVLSRQDASRPAPASAAKGAATEEERAKKIKSRAGELKAAAPNRSFDDCWKQASGEIK